MKNIAISENHLYKKVYAKGDKVFCKHIVVYVLTDYHAARLARANPLKTKVNRVGITVSKKIGKAVVRSRVRRIIREAYRLIETEENVKKGKLIVIVAKEGAEKQKMQKIKAEMAAAFERLEMYE